MVARPVIASILRNDVMHDGWGMVVERRKEQVGMFRQQVEGDSIIQKLSAIR